jgi:hypothetical protein
MKAIVFESKTGFTKKYAQILSKKMNVPCYSQEEAKSKLSQGDEIIFLGWIFASMVKGYKSAAKRYKIKAVGAVGMGDSSQEIIDKLIQSNNLGDTKLFYLQGGFNIEKLKGMNKLLMKMMTSSVKKSLEKKDEKTNKDIESLKRLENGCDFVCEENLSPIINYIK